jgi:predicted amidophosphoribosyltransferase
MNAVKTCKARQYSDQMVCPRCGLQWDVNDPDPPQCRKDEPKPQTPSLIDKLLGRKSTNR